MKKPRQRKREEFGRRIAEYILVKALREVLLNPTSEIVVKA